MSEFKNTCVGKPHYEIGVGLFNTRTVVGSGLTRDKLIELRDELTEMIDNWPRWR